MSEQILVVDRKSEDIQKAQKYVETFVDTNTIQVVTDQTGYNEANEILKMIKLRIKQIKERFEPPKKRAKQVYDDWNQLLKDLIEPFQKLEDDIKGKMKQFLIEQQERERKAREEALKKEEEKRLRDAKALEEAGQQKKADEILDKRITVSKKDIPEMNKGGTYTVTTYSAEVTDLIQLVNAICRNEVSIECVLPNQPYLNQLARQKRDSFKIPGVKLDIKTDVRTRL